MDVFDIVELGVASPTIGDLDNVRHALACTIREDLAVCIRRTANRRYSFRAS